MASDAQVNYAKSLLKRDDRSTDLYPIDRDTPSKAASWLIDKLKNGDDFSPEEYQEQLKSASGYSEYSPPKNEQKSGAGYDKSVFNPILSRIKSETVRTFLEAMIKEIPDYFYHVSASSTDKYHPECSRGEGGLVNHTKVAEQIWEDICDNASFMSKMPRGAADMGRAAIAIHDGWKHGEDGGRYTIHIHPLIPRKVYERKIKGTLGFNDEQEAVIEIILLAIDSHMGPWVDNRNDPTVLPTPEHKDPKISAFRLGVHTADYISSRKYLTLGS